MKKDNPHTTDSTGFDFMANTGLEEKDRDFVGMTVAIVIIVLLTVFQYLKLYRRGHIHGDF